MTQDTQLTYHEVDFLLPAQRFKIQFSYISEKGLPFIREFMLRLVHVAPMKKVQLARFFDFSFLEIDEAVSDLVQRDELTLDASGRLKLTAKAQDYFTGIGEVPQLSMVQDSSASLTFDMETFSCIGKAHIEDNWRSGVHLKVDSNNKSNSEILVAKHFQRQFSLILDKDFLAKTVGSESQERPSVYTVNAVNKLRDLSLRLVTEFKLDERGQSVVRDDFDQLTNSEGVHALMTKELGNLKRSDNTLAISKAMMVLGDEDSLKVFDSKTNTLSPLYLAELQKLEENHNVGRASFLGPIYSRSNWGRVLKELESRLKSLQNRKSDFNPKALTWIAPADPFWGKSERFSASISDVFNKAKTKKKTLYTPTLYLPLSGSDDVFVAKQWENELGVHSKSARGLVEGFLDGNVEIILWEDELAVVVYHCVKTELPTTMPLGFMTTDVDTVKSIGKVVNDYVSGIASFDAPNDCGLLTEIKKPRR